MIREGESASCPEEVFEDSCVDATIDGELCSDRSWTCVTEVQGLRARNGCTCEVEQPRPTCTKNGAKKNTRKKPRKVRTLGRSVRQDLARSTLSEYAFK